jgi:hypothetical protein
MAFIDFQNRKYLFICIYVVGFLLFVLSVEFFIPVIVKNFYDYPLILSIKCALKLVTLIMYCLIVQHKTPEHRVELQNNTIISVEQPINGKNIELIEVKEKICPICLQGYSDDSIIFILDCNHTYHEQCIKEWAITNRTCPMCRTIF